MNNQHLVYICLLYTSFAYKFRWIDFVINDCGNVFLTFLILDVKEEAATCPEVVSYTHLDVYKRQRSSCRCTGGHIRRGARSCRRCRSRRASR